ncbi:MAG: hypothetical protein QOE70_4160 [Chthoniobacter sp.]|jgi:hypothetical protein|nr:hypothetical protein [Chthoniobacter sp.]
MEQKKEESANIDDAERLLNDNWNVRKHLVDQEFALREKTQALILKAASRTDIDEARRAESECRRELTSNTDEYEALVSAWVAAAPR